jgi:hypothetical protein
MRASLGDVRLVKYFAAIASEKPLVGYDPEAEVLYTPLGAELPGLYGRSACLASGKPPRSNASDNLFEYHGVTPELATLLMTKLSH